MPATVNVVRYDVAFWNIAVPETNNYEINVHGLLKLGVVGGFEIELMLSHFL